MDVGQRRDRLPILVRPLQGERTFMAMHCRPDTSQVPLSCGLPLSAKGVLGFRCS